jgi:hypothetical protein
MPDIERGLHGSARLDADHVSTFAILKMTLD